MNPRTFWLSIFSFLLLFSCQSPEAEETKTSLDPGAAREDIEAFLTEWHQDAANARPAYFDKMAAGGIYIGTDKTELWTKEEFEEWCQPYFESGRTWDFNATDRNIYLSDKGSYAWFDELLDTHMGDCRASGVLMRENGSWRIKHYHLSVTVPNDTLDGFVDLVKAYEEKLQFSNQTSADTL